MEAAVFGRISCLRWADNIKICTVCVIWAGKDASQGLQSTEIEKLLLSYQIIDPSSSICLCHRESGISC